MPDRIITGWCFCRNDYMGGYDDDRKIGAGETLSVKGKIKRYEYGLAAFCEPLEALCYAAGPRLCKVQIWGDLIIDDWQVLGRHRKCLWTIDATDLLHEFIYQIAEEVLNSANVTDERYWNAIKARRQWLHNEMTIDEWTEVRMDAARMMGQAVGEERRKVARVVQETTWEDTTQSAWNTAKAATWGKTRKVLFARQNTLLNKLINEQCKEEPTCKS